MSCKKVLMTSILLSLCVMVVLLPGVSNSAQPTPTPQPRQTVKWKVHFIMGPTYLSSKLVKEWADKLYEKSGGRLKLDMYPGGALGIQGKDILDNVKEGLVEMGEMWGAHVAGEERALEALELPGLIPSNPDVRKKVQDAFYADYAKLLEEKYNQYLLAFSLVEPRDIYTRKEVKSLADLQGQKIRTMGTLESNYSRSLGISPTAVDSAEMFTALSQGVVEGIWNVPSGVVSFKLNQIVRYVFQTGIGGASFYFVVNKNAADRLPADVRDLMFTTARDELNPKFQQQAAAIYATGTAQLQQLGVKVVKPSAEDMSKLAQVARPIAVEWLKTAGPTAGQFYQKAAKIVNP